MFVLYTYRISYVNRICFRHIKIDKNIVSYYAFRGFAPITKFHREEIPGDFVEIGILDKPKLRKLGNFFS